MTNVGFVASWVLFFIAGIMILGPELGGEDGSKVKADLDGLRVVPDERSSPRAEALGSA